MALSSAASPEPSSEGEDASTTQSSTCEINTFSTATSSLALDVALKGELVCGSRPCCCASAEEMNGHWMDQPLIGWQDRSVKSPLIGLGSASGSVSCMSTQLSEVSLNSLSDPTGHFFECVPSQLFKSSSSSSSSNSTAKTYNRPSHAHSSRGVISLGSDSKSSLRSYIYSSPAIPFAFHHHVNVSDEDTSSVYMEEYKKGYTYPTLKERNKRIPESLNSVPTTVKPTLFVLNNDIRHPLHYKKKQDSGTGKPKSKSDSYNVCEMPHYKTVETGTPSAHYSTAPTPLAVPIAHVPGKSRELGVPRNYFSLNPPPQNDIIQVPHRSPVIARSDKIANGTSNASEKGMAVPSYIMMEHQSSPVPSPPTTSGSWDSVKLPITHVNPLPTYSKHYTSVRRGFLKPSLFTSPLPTRASSNVAERKSTLHLTRNSRLSHQYSSPCFQSRSVKK